MFFVEVRVLHYLSYIRIYINDLPSCLSVGSPRMFADDTNITFVAGTTSELESLINIELQNLNQ